MQPRADLLVRHRSMTDGVTERVRRLILSRELVPGQRIRQAELASLMGVSTMPVREALLRLVSEGMVVAESNRSFIVSTSTTPDGIRDIYWIHAELAGELAARAWDRKTPELLEELNRHHRTYVAAVPLGDPTILFESNWSFHAAIHHMAAAPAIALVMKNTVRYFPDFSHDWPGWNELGVEWQAGLIEQFTHGDREGARAVVHEYCQKSAAIYVAASWNDTTDTPVSDSERPGPTTKPRASRAKGQPASSNGKTRKPPASAARKS